MTLTAKAHRAACGNGGGHFSKPSVEDPAEARQVVVEKVMGMVRER